MFEIWFNLLSKKLLEPNLLYDLSSQLNPSFGKISVSTPNITVQQTQPGPPKKLTLFEI